MKYVGIFFIEFWNLVYIYMYIEKVIDWKRVKWLIDEYMNFEDIYIY